MNLNELMLKSESDLNENQRLFIEVHSNILSAGSLLVNSLVSLSKNLKRMRDEKLFLEIGCQSFEDYAEKICGLKRRQAYAYIQVIERLGENFVHSNAQIGIAKLTLLSTLSDEEKVVVTETVSIEDVSVKELKSQIEKLKSRNKTLEEKGKSDDAELSKLKQDINNLKNQKMLPENSEIKDKLNLAETKLKEYLQNVETLKKEKIDLEKKLEINNNSILVEFKVKFKDFQIRLKDLRDLISSLPEKEKQSCQNALKKVVEQI